ncbi:MAG: tetratricopeptide repeat protein [Burkholderiales bacterium]
MSTPSPAATVTLADALQQALADHRAGRLDDAERLYRRILAVVPGQFDALHLLGVIAVQRGQLAEGERLIRRALAERPGAPEAVGNLANVLQRLGRHAEALAACDEAAAARPDDPELWNTRGLALYGLGRFDEAVAAYDAALALAPRHVIALANRGNALRRQERAAEALASIEQALGIAPDFVPAWQGRATVLMVLGRHVEALGSLDRALALAPRNAVLHQMRGNVLHALGRGNDAIVAYSHAVEADPRAADAWTMRGHALHALGHHEQAMRDFANAVAVAPGDGFALSMYSLLRLYNAEWEGRDALLARLTQCVREDSGAVEPFALLVQTESAADQLTCARQAADARFPTAAQPLHRAASYGHARLRVAYLSADFREHATAYLIAELIERHDRNRFEVTGLSWCAEQATPIRERLRRGFDRFLDVREWSDRGVATWLADNEIDIVVDLMGLTNGARPGICALRPAPVQVNFLGYPGTCGTAHYDYLIADATVIPPGAEAYYAEQVVRMPGCYQPNDRQRAIARHVPARTELGLPADGFVFCAMNATYKITPALWDVWMRLLAAVPGSVLWLLDGGATATANLRREAQARGVAPGRIVVAPRVPLAHYLARMQRADLFLDTLPCTAHTTASDALWAGLPLVTCLGSTFAGRVAGSVVRAAGLPDLVAENLADYEALALRLATHPDALAAVRARLLAQRGTCALFASDRYRQHLEVAFATMCERAAAGLPPAGFDVPALA